MLLLLELSELTTAVQLGAAAVPHTHCSPECCVLPNAHRRIHVTAAARHAKPAANPLVQQHTHS
jgi:hypothetical protein